MRLLRVAEVAEMMSVSPMTIYRMIHEGELPAVRIGRAFRIDERAVQAYLSRHGIGWLPPR